jgi:GGDEF domain-containing protein
LEGHERVIDKRLEAIALHDSLHGCRTVSVIEAKLTQQLAHIKQTPFYGVFIDLKKDFDAMDQERCR